MVPLADTAIKAEECRRTLREGKDPLELRKAARLAEALGRACIVTLDKCVVADIYIRAYALSST